MSTINEILAGGNIAEQFEETYAKVMANMEDTATDPRAKRKITLEITFTQDYEREMMKYDIQIKEKLAPKMAKRAEVCIAKPIPGQISLDEYISSGMAAGLQIVDTKTGEILGKDPEEESEE